MLGTGAVLGGFGAGDVEERLEVGGGSGGSVGVLLQLRLEFGGALSGLVGGGVRCVKVALQPVSPVAVLCGFGGGDVRSAWRSAAAVAAASVCCWSWASSAAALSECLADLLVELLLEPVDLGAGLGGSILGSAGVMLCFLKLRLELGDTVAHALHLVGRRRAGLIELGLELLGPVAVLGGFGAGDVEERLEVGGGDRGGVGVLLEVGFEFAGALSGLVAGGARLVAFGLESVGAVAMLLEFGRRGIEARLEIGGGSGGGVGVLLQLGFELGGPRVGGGCDLGGVRGGLPLCSSSCFLRRSISVLASVAWSSAARASRWTRARWASIWVTRVVARSSVAAEAARAWSSSVWSCSARVAVLGGFGAGDVEERLEVGGGDRGGVGVLLGGGLRVRLVRCPAWSPAARASSRSVWSRSARSRCSWSSVVVASRRAWRSAAAVAAASVCCCSWASSSADRASAAAVTSAAFSAACRGSARRVVS